MVILVLLVSKLILPSAAHANIDPGSGSVIVTTVLGLIAAIGYSFRKYFYKIRRKLLGNTVEENLNDQKE